MATLGRCLCQRIRPCVSVIYHFITVWAICLRQAIFMQRTQFIHATTGWPLSAAATAENPLMRVGPLNLTKQTHFTVGRAAAIYCGANHSPLMGDDGSFSKKANFPSPARISGTHGANWRNAGTTSGRLPPPVCRCPAVGAGRLVAAICDRGFTLLILRCV